MHIFTKRDMNVSTLLGRLSELIRSGGVPLTLLYHSLTVDSYFAEHTTQQEGLCNKLKGDLEKCFDESKTGIPVDKIEEVVFCHTSTISPEEEDTLAEECGKHGINLNIFGIGPLSYDLYQKYPMLARDFLGVEVDTGQVVDPDDFITAYNKNKLATRLDTAFHFRESEVKTILESL